MNKFSRDLVQGMEAAAAFAEGGKRRVRARRRNSRRACNLFGIIGYLQKQTGVELHVATGARVKGNDTGRACAYRVSR